MTQSIVVTDRLSKTYSAHLFQQTKKALSSVSFSVSKGEVFGIVGPNGAGKSTLLKILLGFITNYSGKATINDLSPDHPECRQAIGYLPETSSLYSHLSIQDHLKFAGRIGGLKHVTLKERIDTILDEVGLSNVAKKQIHSYSKGMNQRAALAYALFLRPEILILDEPMSGLDPLGRQLVIDLIRDYNKKGHTILFCSHILSDIERICDRIGIMNKGELVTIINPNELQAPTDIKWNRSPLESFFMKTITEIGGGEI